MTATFTMKFFHRNKKPVTPSPEELSDEARLGKLLDKYRAESDETERKKIEQEIIELIDHYFRLSLRPVMAMLFGPQMLASGEGNSEGFTVLLYDFFEKVLATRPDEIWRARTARDLRNWSSTVMANQMRDYLRRKKLGQEIKNDVIKPWYEQRERHFEKRFPERFDAFIEWLDCKEALGKLPQEQRRLLQIHYLDGMTWEETAEELGLSKSAFFRQREAALKRLREELM